MLGGYNEDGAADCRVKEEKTSPLHKRNGGNLLSRSTDYDL